MLSNWYFEQKGWSGTWQLSPVSRAAKNAAEILIESLEKFTGETEETMPVHWWEFWHIQDEIFQSPWQTNVNAVEVLEKTHT